MVRASSILKIKDGRYQVSFIIFVSVKKPQFIYVFTTKITHRLRFEISLATIMDKSLGTLLHFWGVLQFTYAQPIPSPQNNVGRVQLCIGWGGGRTARKVRKGCTVLWGNPGIKGKYEHYLTLPKTFFRDCRRRSYKLVKAIDWGTTSTAYTSSDTHEFSCELLQTKFTRVNGKVLPYQFQKHWKFNAPNTGGPSELFEAPSCHAPHVIPYIYCIS